MHTNKALVIFSLLETTSNKVVDLVIICQFTRGPEKNEDKETTSHTGHPFEAVQVH